MTTHSRYTVSDPVCGMVDSFARKADAFREASRHQDRHQVEGDRVAVTTFDRMARHDAPNEWDAWGKCIAYCQ